MISFEISVEKVNVDIENGVAIITGVDISELIEEIGAEYILDNMEYLDITDYVTEQEQIKKELEDEARSDNEQF